LRRVAQVVHRNEHRLKDRLRESRQVRKIIKGKTERAATHE
jgi:hypothetical protein